MKYLKIIYLDSTIECMQTSLDYNLGKMIFLNNCDLFKCVKITHDEVNGDIYYHFKQIM